MIDGCTACACWKSVVAHSTYTECSRHEAAWKAAADNMVGVKVIVALLRLLFLFGVENALRSCQDQPSGS